MIEIHPYKERNFTNVFNYVNKLHDDYRLTIGREKNVNTDNTNNTFYPFNNKNRSISNAFSDNEQDNIDDNEMFNDVF